MFKRYSGFFISGLCSVLLVSACAKRQGTERKNGSHLNQEPQPSGKVNNDDLYEKNKENFQPCLTATAEKLLTAEGLGEYTVEGKNLKAVLTSATGQPTVRASLESLEKSNKGVHDDISERIKLISEVMDAHKDFEPRKKYLFFESVLQELLLIEDHVLSETEVKTIAAQLQKPSSSSIFKGESSLNSIQNELTRNIDALLEKAAEKLSGQKQHLKTIADRIDKKDKTLQQEYKKISEGLLLMSKSLEKNACTQMILEKSDKKGDALVNYLQTAKLMIDLEAFKNVKTETGQKRKL